MKLKKYIASMLARNCISKQILSALIAAKCIVFGVVNYVRYRKRMKSVKYVHLMYNEKFNKPFVDFLNKYFDSEEHFIICRNFCDKLVPTGSNVALVKTYWGFNLRLPNIKWIYAHSLFDGQVLEYLYYHRQILSKTCWIVWGGSDPFFQRRDKYVMKVCPYFGMYSVGTDTRNLKGLYAPQGVFVNPGGYQFPISKETMDKLLSKPRNDTDGKPVVIQINHSRDESTLEMLQLLARFKDENLIVRTVLSYSPSNQMKYKEEIIACGERLFGKKFIPVLDFMDAEHYAASLFENDILVMNQPRSQGLGNIVASLYLGTKVFIRSDVSSYRALRDEGAIIHDTLSIKDISWDEFVRHPQQEIDQNRKCAYNRVDDGVMVEKYVETYGWKRR